MMNKKVILVGLLTLSPLLGAEFDISHTDILERFLNFLLFIGILWIFFAGKLKEFFQVRRSQVSERLEELQIQLKTSKENKRKFLKELEKAKEQAESIISDAHKEAYTITQKYELQTKTDVENLIKNSKVLMDMEVRKVKKELIEGVFADLKESKKVAFNAKDYVNILQQRL
ncbi:F0F1 ATP synthase subunit B [Helicobacter cetorum]|uniref:F0F1 ATP synthase subunit B n=1 Tax=Helicobacter cetorum TaxID=138563 RepID=UPI000CF10779|nr:F0F1 ATP synthase subunit B [Helicobacter cetorum]